MRNTGAPGQSTTRYPLYRLSTGKVGSEGLILLLVFIAVFGTACSSKKADGDSSPKSTQITRPIFYPEATGSFPAVLVLPPAGSPVSVHADIVSRRLAKEGYVARAVSYGEKTSGGILNDAKRLDRLKHLTSQSLANLKIQPAVDPNRIGVIGYSFGGFFATYLASSAEENGLGAAVIYYGVYRVPELMKNLRVPILAFQGDADSYKTFVDQALAMQRIARDNHRQFDLVIYRNVEHGFDFDSSPVYNAAAAVDAWHKTIAFLDKHVKRR
jgi:dienelactone hydrolase